MNLVITAKREDFGILGKRKLYKFLYMYLTPVSGTNAKSPIPERALIFDHLNTRTLYEHMRRNNARTGQPDFRLLNHFPFIRQVVHNKICYRSYILLENTFN